MKKKNTLFSVLARVNMWKPLVQDIIVFFSSYPALLIEVFTRHKFGQRYFSMSSSLIAIFLLLAFGLASRGFQEFIAMLIGAQRSDVRTDGYEYTLLIFALAALIMSIRHKLEIMRHGQTIDFKRFSRSHGEPRSYWYRLSEILPARWLERLPLTHENIWRYYEPLAAILIGLLLLPIPFTRLLGALLIVCGLFYYWRTSIQYAWGNNHVLNLIDDILLAEGLRDYMSPEPVQNNKGVHVYTPMPDDPHLKQRLMERLTQELDEPDPQMLNA